ncbi:MAG: alkaline phosphatase family protein [Clostridia bacterium]|nr:alkaline phosphatase family protein [Clostridia bacterium]
MKNPNNLDSLAAALAHIIGIEPPEQAATANEDLCRYATDALCGQKADRVFMYNPDAIAQWIYQKYPAMLTQVKQQTDIEIPLCTVMPSVTPVCFATMYTGTQPAVHGIQSYTKPVLQIDTLFDALIRSDKKAAIVSTSGDSMSKIFLERNMDYFFYDTVEQANAKACELILRDQHDFIAVYNGNYDSFMHKFGPESMEALAELRCNVRTFGMFAELIANNWQSHNTLLGFAMDHGCHEIDGDCGSHGLDMDEDLNITHLYKVLPASKDSQ